MVKIKVIGFWGLAGKDMILIRKSKHILSEKRIFRMAEAVCARGEDPEFFPPEDGNLLSKRNIPPLENSPKYPLKPGVVFSDRSRKF